MDRRATLRKRKREQEDVKLGGIQKLLEAAKRCRRVVVFSGSGLSATSGMSTFSTKGGLYERAQRRFGISEGKKLFTYSFFEKRKLDAQAFFADIYAETKKAKPAAGHRAIASLAASGKLQRHYTLNVDGLAARVGLSTWHPTDNPTGSTVEIHGSIRQMVCTECNAVVAMSEALLRKLKSKQHVPCSSCSCDSIRCRIMLYDDAEDDCITPDNVFDIMEEDVQAADLILWIGISFEQSASTAYFRRVRSFLGSAGRLADCCQAVINLSEDAHWNLLSSCSNTGELDVLEVLGSSDDILPLVAAIMSDQSAEPPSRPPSQPRSPAPDQPSRRGRISPRTESVPASPEPSEALSQALSTAEQPSRIQTHAAGTTESEALSEDPLSLDQAGRAQTHAAMTENPEEHLGPPEKHSEAEPPLSLSTVAAEAAKREVTATRQSAVGPKVAEVGTGACRQDTAGLEATRMDEAVMCDIDGENAQAAAVQPSGITSEAARMDEGEVCGNEGESAQAAEAQPNGIHSEGAANSWAEAATAARIARETSSALGTEPITDFSAQMPLKFEVMAGMSDAGLNSVGLTASAVSNPSLLAQAMGNGSCSLPSDRPMPAGPWRSSSRFVRRL